MSDESMCDTGESMCDTGSNTGIWTWRRGISVCLAIAIAVMASCSNGITAAEIEAGVVAHRDRVVVEVTGGGCVVRPSGEIDCSLWDTEADSYRGNARGFEAVLLDPPHGLFTSIDRVDSYSEWSFDTLCGLREDGVIVCWVATIDMRSWDILGLDWEEVTSDWHWEPGLPSQGNFVALASAGSQGDRVGSLCGVTSEGGIQCRSIGSRRETDATRHFEPWGDSQLVLDDIEYEFDNPADKFLSVQASESKSNWGDMCGIGRDGRVSCWGFDPRVPPDIRFQSIALGLNLGKYDDDHNPKYLMCGVSVEGDLHCWGQFGWLSNPDLSHVMIEGEFASVDMFKYSLDGDQLLCALTQAGEIACWWSDADFGDLDGLREDFDRVSSDPEVLQRRRDAGLDRVAEFYGEGYVDLAILERTVTEGTMACGVLPDGSMECWARDTPGLSRIDWNPGPVRAG